MRIGRTRGLCFVRDRRGRSLPVRSGLDCPNLVLCRDAKDSKILVCDFVKAGLSSDSPGTGRRE